MPSQPRLDLRGDVILDGAAGGDPPEIGPHFVFARVQHAGVVALLLVILLIRLRHLWYSDGGVRSWLQLVQNLTDVHGFLLILMLCSSLCDILGYLIEGIIS